MWLETPVFAEDLKKIAAASFIPWQELDGRVILVTGATGLIGSTVVNALLYYGMQRRNPPHVLALVRDLDKARTLFSAQLEACAGSLTFVTGDVCSPIEPAGPIDYMIHCASPTASRYFVEHPVETIMTAVNGTENMLQLAQRKQVRSFVYLSSMEAYGSPTTKIDLTEDAGAYFDSMSPRSCYPQGKRMSETLCAAYSAEYQVPARVVRLAQTFGPGISSADTRVFADFARKARNGEDIQIATKGDSERMYLYTMDAVSAILTVLLKGENGQLYNAANMQTYCSILDMAGMIAETLAVKPIQVKVLCNPELSKKYPAAHKLYMDTAKIEQLGWVPHYTLEQMFQRMVAAF